MTANARPDALVRQLRELLLECDATKHTTLWRQYMRRDKAVDARFNALLHQEGGLNQQVLDTRCDLMLADDALPTLLVSLLGRLTNTAKPSPSACRLTNKQLEALLTLVKGLHYATIRAVGSVGDQNHPAGSAAERFLSGVAEVQPTGALTTLMALLIRPTTLQLETALPTSDFAYTVYLCNNLSTDAAHVALQLMSSAAASPLVAAALARDPGTAQLLACTCDTVLDLLSLPEELAPPDVLAACIFCLTDTLGARTAGFQLRPDGAGSRAAAFVASPRVASVLLAAVCRWRWGQLDDSLGTLAARALTLWLEAQAHARQQAEGEGTWPAGELASDTLIAAIPGATEIGPAAGGALSQLATHSTACSLLSTLLLLSNTSCEVRHRAFPAVAAYAERVVDSLLSNATAAAAATAAGAATATAAVATAASRDRGGTCSSSSNSDSSGTVGHSSMGLTCAKVLRLLNACLGHPELKPILAGENPPAQAVVRQLRVRAQWCTQHRLVGKCEALLRLCSGGDRMYLGSNSSDSGHSGGGGSDSNGSPIWDAHVTKAAVALTRDLAAHTHMLMLHSMKDGAVAQVAHQSLLVTVRKVLQTQGLASCGQAAAGRRGSAPFVGTAAGVAARPLGEWVDALTVEVQAFESAAVPLQLPPAGATAALRHAAMQLLSPAVRRATALLTGAHAACLPEQLRDVFFLLGLLPYFHLHAGLADVTAAAGAPALLNSALRVTAATAPRVGSLSSRTNVPPLVLSALYTARSHAGWMRAAERLWLIGQTQACLASAGSLLCRSGSPTLRFLAPAPHALDGGFADMEAIMLATILDLNACVKVVTSGGAPGEPTLSWDDCLLAMLSPPSSGSSATADCTATVPFFGCCHRRCTNLNGATEADLHLRKCGGCRLARYCSVACQRRAWRTGHRRACQAWQQGSTSSGQAGAMVLAAPLPQQRMHQQRQAI